MCLFLNQFSSNNFFKMNIPIEQGKFIAIKKKNKSNLKITKIKTRYWSILIHFYWSIRIRTWWKLFNSILSETKQQQQIKLLCFWKLLIKLSQASVNVDSCERIGNGFFFLVCRIQICTERNIFNSLRWNKWNECEYSWGEFLMLDLYL